MAQPVTATVTQDGGAPTEDQPTVVPQQPAGWTPSPPKRQKNLTQQQDEEVDECACYCCIL